MKNSMKLVLAITGAALLAATAAGARGWGDDFVPREPTVKQPGHYEWSWDGKDDLALQAPVTLHYSPGGTPRIIATGPEEALAHLRVGQGHLAVDDDWHFSGRDRIEITVTGVTVHSIAVAGSGEVHLDKLDLDRLNLVIAGSGSVEGDGRVDHVNLSIAGSGRADLAHLAVRTANIQIAGSGDTTLTPKDQANVSIVGSGSVRMAAQPAHLSQKITGSGGVRTDN